MTGNVIQLSISKLEHKGDLKGDPKGSYFSKKICIFKAAYLEAAYLKALLHYVRLLGSASSGFPPMASKTLLQGVV